MNPNYKTTGDIEPESLEYPDFPVALSSAITQPFQRHKKDYDKADHTSSGTDFPDLCGENPELMKTDMRQNRETEHGNHVKYPDFSFP